MKAVLEFNLPEEKEEFDAAVKANSAFSAITEFYNESIRRRIKYTQLSKKDHKLVSEIQEEFVRIMNEYEIEF